MSRQCLLLKPYRNHYYTFVYIVVYTALCVYVCVICTCMYLSLWGVSDILLFHSPPCASEAGSPVESITNVFFFFFLLDWQPPSRCPSVFTLGPHLTFYMGVEINPCPYFCATSALNYWFTPALGHQIFKYDKFQIQSWKFRQILENTSYISSFKGEKFNCSNLNQVSWGLHKITYVLLFHWWV